LRRENKKTELGIRNDIMNIVNLLDAAFEHALQKREEKERLVEEMPDMDR
jgi:hypothetical protein